MDKFFKFTNMMIEKKYADDLENNFEELYAAFLLKKLKIFELTQDLIDESLFYLRSF